MIEKAQGLAVASPMPTPMRAAASWPKFCAKPESAVIADQTERPIVIRRPRYHMSASRPSGMPNSE